jgi:hypothetical protein
MIMKPGNKMVIGFSEVGKIFNDSGTAVGKKNVNSPVDEVQTDGICYICKKETRNLSGDPGKWRLDLNYPGGNGAKRQYHYECVIKVLAEHCV